MSSKKIEAAKVAHYFMIYCAFLIENGLPDDSKTIKVADLVYYVEEHIGQDDQIRLLEEKNLIHTYIINHN